jgi:acyl-CoA synthetase (AMP-forming)/AMP-acid ligase II
MPVINRHLINPDIDFDGANRDDLFRLINRWKRLLVYGYGADKGQVLALAIITPNTNHVACVFAAAELGLKLLVISKPIAKETIHATKMGIFGPVDITVSQGFPLDDPHHDMVQTYSKQVCLESEIDTVISDDDVMSPVITEDDEFLFASTSGTTGKSKPVMFTHRETLAISKRNLSVFDITKETIAQHTSSFHHASAMLTFMLPTLMVADKHYYGTMALIDIGFIKNSTPENFVKEFILEKNVNAMMLTAPVGIKWLLDAMEPHKHLIKTKIKINISGFTVFEKLYDDAKNLPIEFYSHYGSVDTGIPLLVNHIDENSFYEKDKLGVAPDDFYKIDGEYITCPVLWEEPRKLPDQLYVRDGVYFYGERIENGADYSIALKELFDEQIGDHTFCKTENGGYLIIWDENANIDFEGGKSYVHKSFSRVVYLNKQNFMVDTKVSMEQLRAYLEHHYEQVQD